MGDTIQTTIDSAGRLVLPKVIRDEAGILPGMTLRITVQEGQYGKRESGKRQFRERDRRRPVLSQSFEDDLEKVYHGNGEETLAVMRGSLERIAEAWQAADIQQLLPPAHWRALREYWESSRLLRSYGWKLRSLP